LTSDEKRQSDRVQDVIGDIIGGEDGN